MNRAVAYESVSQAPSERRRPAALSRITIVAPTLEILGGHGVQALELVRGLRSEGYEVDFLPINPSFPPELRRLKRYRYVRTAINEALYLQSLCRLRRADVVHVFSASYWSFLLSPMPALLAARALKKRVILNYHSGEAEDHLANWGRRVHPWLRLADAIVVPSEYLRDVFARFGYEARVVPNIVDIERFRYRERAPIRPRLLSTRNLDPYYGVDNTLRAFAILKSKLPDATLTVAGYGSEETRLRQLAGSLGMNGIRFVGRIEPPAMPYLYDEGDIFLNSSRIDNQPISILEAFAAGLPVVSTPTGDIRSMVLDGQTGVIVPPDDPGAMAAAAAALLSQPDRAAAIAQRARAMVEKRTWARVRDQWLEAYQAPFRETDGIDTATL